MNSCAMPQTENPSRLKKFWRERVVGLIGAQLTQGVTPQKVALTIALGINLAMFPILGSTTLLCAAVAFWLKLNQPIIQLVNWLAYPLQFAMLLPFIRIGEWLTRAPKVNFSIPQMLQRFHDAPGKFLGEFGMTGVHGIIAWLLIAPVLSALIYFTLLPPLKKLSQLKK
jgi:uncharacterized protein (DUF2062 family)